MCDKQIRSKSLSII